mmetsp:Transcript_20720/g.56599  ORF Transcript_20720/g.56599 Transcript_20720/m.56599 type:complete len:215 (-) Transcript_20720:39-683(-)
MGPRGPQRRGRGLHVPLQQALQRRGCQEGVRNILSHGWRARPLHEARGGVLPRRGAGAPQHPRPGGRRRLARRAPRRAGEEDLARAGPPRLGPPDARHGQRQAPEPRGAGRGAAAARVAGALRARLGDPLRLPRVRRERAPVAAEGLQAARAQGLPAQGGDQGVRREPARRDARAVRGPRRLHALRVRAPGESFWRSQRLPLEILSRAGGCPVQ